MRHRPTAGHVITAQEILLPNEVIGKDAQIQDEENGIAEALEVRSSEWKELTIHSKLAPPGIDLPAGACQGC